MRSFRITVLGAAVLAVSACGGADQRASSNEANETAQNSIAAQQPVQPTDDRNRVQTIERTTGDGNRVLTRELVGPDVQARGARPLRADEIQEIERVTGRPYQEGDSIHGRAQDAPR